VRPSRSTEPLVVDASLLTVAEEMQQGCIEQRGILQEGEVACVGQDQQSGSRARGGDVFRVRALDRLVVVAVSHQHRRADRLQLCVRPVRLSLLHLADLRDEGVVVLRCRRSGKTMLKADSEALSR
jgi:hypothetical protein